MPEPTPTAPEELFRQGMRLMLDKDIPGWVDLWSEDGWMEFPFAPPGWPGRLEGRPAIADYVRDYPEHIDLRDVPEMVLHRTADPEVVVVEMRAVGLLVRTGAPFESTYVGVVRVRDGRFVSYRDYWNPLVVQQPGADFIGAAR